MKVFPHEKLIVPASGNLWIKQSDTLPDAPATKQSRQINPSTKKAGSIDSYSYHRHVMTLIIDDIIKEGLAKNRKGIVWAALTDSVLILNGKTLPEVLHQKLKEKYHIVADQGYYYGPVKIYGKGYSFDNIDFN